MTLVPYIRQSRRRERDVSFEQQWDAIESWARSNGATLSVENLREADAAGLVERKTSGAKSWRERELGKVIASCERGEASGVIVFDQSRLTREDLLGTAEVWDALQKAKADLIDATGGGKVRRMDYVVKAEMNRQQWEAARDRGVDSRRRAVARGVHVSGQVPYGYRKQDDEGRLLDEGRFVVSEEQAEAVRFLFRSRASGRSWHSIAAEMDDRWPREGGGRWSPSRLQWMVKNDVYRGVASSGQFRNENAHPALVSRAEFEAAQSNGERRRWRGETKLLSGLARCGSCGYALRKDFSRADFARYSCGGRKAGGICEHPVTIGATRLENYIEEAFLARLAAEPVAVDVTVAEREMGDAVATLEAAEEELAAYLRTNLVTVVGEQVFREGVVKREEHVREASAAVADLRRRSPAVPAAIVLAEAWGDLTVPERRSVLAATLREVVVDPALGRGSRRPVSERVRLVWLDDA